jgi:hypothetical protein
MSKEHMESYMGVKMSEKHKCSVCGFESERYEDLSQKAEVTGKTKLPIYLKLFLEHRAYLFVGSAFSKPLA